MHGMAEQARFICELMSESAFSTSARVSASPSWYTATRLDAGANTAPITSTTVSMATLHFSSFTSPRSRRAKTSVAARAPLTTLRQPSAATYFLASNLPDDLRCGSLVEESGSEGGTSGDSAEAPK
eukprot:CAMPEP_0114247986 /NCGR_PEP_ID=MMETSP0058-20121206/13321_1 /TAXON_ID=36894 /ORGANISM="Pyramimonas parkeae, CCMP726" /LENGTH=125 /DNA_ID=CAMNT_0001361341 /DNA_START=977 /DNA_END=1354 /DNA_ORIENTATION=-